MTLPRLILVLRALRALFPDCRCRLTLRRPAVIPGLGDAHHIVESRPGNCNRVALLNTKVCLRLLARDT